MCNNKTPKADLTTAECIDEVFDEIEDVLINSLQQLHVVDLSKVEKDTYIKKKGTYAVEMCVEYTDENSYPVFDKEIWRQITKYLIKRCKYVEFSCWHTDNEKIQEIVTRMKSCDKSKVLNQINVKGEITQEIIELITENFLDENGNVKWFYISLYVNQDRGSQIFHANHYGTNFIIDELDEEDLQYVKSIVAEDGLTIDDIILN